MRAISIRTGLLMLGGFVLFFLLMYVLGLGHVSELRLFNGVIHLVCMSMAVRAYYHLHPENKENYVTGVIQGMSASIIGVLGFASFITIMLTIDPSLMAAIRNKSNFGAALTPFMAGVFIVTEGIVVGLVGSYLVTRMYLRNKTEEV